MSSVFLGPGIVAGGSGSEAAGSREAAVGSVRGAGRGRRQGGALPWWDAKTSKIKGAVIDTRRTDGIGV